MKDGSINHAAIFNWLWGFIKGMLTYIFLHSQLNFTGIFSKPRKGPLPLLPHEQSWDWKSHKVFLVV